MLQQSHRAYHPAAAIALGWAVSFVTATLAATSTASDFPLPNRPVAPIVSATWGDHSRRDAANEVGQIAAQLHLRQGQAVADIGAGSGYDTLRLSRLVGPGGTVFAEDVMPLYLRSLGLSVRTLALSNVRIVLGAPDDPHLAPASIDAAIMVHMYHEIARPYDVLYHLAAAFRPDGVLGIEELDRPTQFHGTPPALLTCELRAAGYRRLSLTQMQGGLGYFAVFAPPAPGRAPRPDRIRPCSPIGLQHP